MTTERVKVWSQLGLVAMVAGAVAAQPAFAASVGHDHSLMQMAQASQGGEGGEGAAQPEVTGLTGASEDTALTVNIGMVRGHLNAAAELVKAGKFKDAVPHVHHPIEEIYPDLEAPLAARKIVGLKQALETLHEAVEAEKADDIATHLAAALALCDAADKSVKEQGTPAFEADAGLRLLKMAVPEYAEAIKDGRIVNIVEYQDARGFMLEGARRLALGKSTVADADAAGDLDRAIATILSVFPTIDPPETPIKSASAISGLVSLAELSLSLQ